MAIGIDIGLAVSGVALVTAIVWSIMVFRSTTLPAAWNWWALILIVVASYFTTFFGVWLAADAAAESAKAVEGLTQVPPEVYVPQAAMAGTIGASTALVVIAIALAIGSKITAPKNRFVGFAKTRSTEVAAAITLASAFVVGTVVTAFLYGST